MGVLLSSARRVRKDKMSNKVDAQSAYSHIYHEKQVKELCAMHAINNLLQKQAFVQKDIDKICTNLSPSYFFNPHRSMFGTGNYDVNVIMVAMESLNKEVVWFDKRKDVGELNFENIEGFILNIPSDYKLAGFSIPFNFNRKHWIAIRKVGEEYYNLDSKLKCPELLGKESDAVRYLQDQLHEKERELLLIVTTQVAKNTSWRTEGEDQI